MALLKARKPIELKPDDLKWTCDTKVFDFENTEKIKPIEGIVGQERALKALRIGVDLKSPGYNIFITGLSGTGKFTTIKMMLESITPDCSHLSDYAYVNNFKDEDRPTLLRFPAGQATKFKKDLSRTIKFLQEKIPQLLLTDPFINTKKQVLTEYGKLQQTTMNAFEEKLKKDNFTLGQVKVGELVRPEILAVIDGQPVFVHQLEELVSSEKITKEKVEEILTKYSTYQDELQRVFRESLKLTQDYQEKVLKLEGEFVNEFIALTLDELKKKYKIHSVKEYLDQVHESIIQNLEVFKGQKPIREETDGNCY